MGLPLEHFVGPLLQHLLRVAPPPRPPATPLSAAAAAAERPAPASPVRPVGSPLRQAAEVGPGALAGPEPPSPAAAEAGAGTRPMALQGGPRPGGGAEASRRSRGSRDTQRAAAKGKQAAGGAADAVGDAPNAAPAKRQRSRERSGSRSRGKRRRASSSRERCSTGKAPKAGPGGTQGRGQGQAAVVVAAASRRGAAVSAAAAPAAADVGGSRRRLPKASGGGSTRHGRSSRHSRSRSRSRTPGLPGAGVASAARRHERKTTSPTPRRHRSGACGEGLGTCHGRRAAAACADGTGE